MSNFFEEESPWAPTSYGAEIPALDNSFEESSTPWGAPRDESGDDTGEAEYNPYADPYEDDNAPLVSSHAAEESSNAGDDTQLAAAAQEEPVLKPQSAHKSSKTGRKKRGGSAIKIESVSGADPLLASGVKTDELTDVSLAHSTADLNLNADGAGAGHQASSSPLHSAPTETSAPPRDATQLPSDFEITVSDPSKVGDITNAHTVYTVHMTTTNQAYKEKEASVQRRYRDFRWLYRTLEHNHPGVIVSPPPEKQAVGRFNDEFIQQRRYGLEQMLKKIVAHRLLKTDNDLEAFLTSTDFGEYLKVRLMGDEELERATGSLVSSGDYPTTSSTGSGGSSGGIIGTLSGALSLSRGAEADPWTVEKRQHLDIVEGQLRASTKSLASVGMQRQHLSDTVADFANVTRALADVEATRRLSTVLRAFAKVHERLSQLYQRQKQQDLLTLEATLDEHLRVIGSTRNVLIVRQRVFSAAESAASELEKRQGALDRLLRQGRTQEDRKLALEEEVEQLSARASSLHQQAADIAHLVESEMSRVEHEKITEFRNSVELYLETAVESQKEAIEIWETFYTRYFAAPQDRQ